MLNLQKVVFTNNSFEKSYAHSQWRDPFSYLICKLLFKKKKSHMRTHRGEKPFLCLICKKLFVQKSHFKIHMRTHRGEKPFLCSYCNKSFSKRSSLKVRILSHTVPGIQETNTHVHNAINHIFRRIP